MKLRFTRVLLPVVAVLCLLAATAGAQTQPDLSKVADEALVWLQELIRINTVDPPGNELAAAKYLAGILDKEGIPAEVIETAPSRGVVVARLRATLVPDPAKALLLLGHMDTVGVDKAKWSVDPFGAVIKGGYLYGRGAIDDKGMTIANLAVMVALKRSGARLDRDVIFLAEGDEEMGGDYGIDFVIKRNWDKIAAGFAINEGGRVMLENGKVQYVGIQASEKIPVDVEVIATGPSGHGSMPRKDNPVAHLAAAVAKISGYETKLQLNAVTRRYFEQLARVEDPETSKWMRALETPERFDIAARRLAEMSPMWSSMLRDSIAPTMLRAGIKSNVVPSEARATLNIRLLPGNTIEGLVADLQKLVNDPQVRFEIDRTGTRPPSPPSSLDNALYQAMERVTPQVFPNTVVVPFMSTGATDSAQLRLHNVQAFGLLPFPLAEEDAQRMHADDERIPLDSFRKGVEYLYRIVDEFARAK